jgi:hypothetical protein
MRKDAEDTETQALGPFGKNGNARKSAKFLLPC